jgi:membrane protein
LGRLWRITPSFRFPRCCCWIAGVVGHFYEGDVGSVLEQQATVLLGEATARSLTETLRTQTEGRGVATGVFGLGLLLFGASGLFGQLQDAMNTIWEVKPKEGRGFVGILKDRFLSFTMVLGTAFLLLTSLLITAGISAVFQWTQGRATFLHFLESILSFIVVAVLFALIFKILPDVKIAWSDVWIGAAATSALFLIGKFLIGVYLGRSAVASSYGAAGPVIVLVVWVYYSAQILFLGAEFTQVYANRYGSRLTPSENAEPVTAEKRRQEGMA